MARKVRSMKGEEVDFDLLKTKQEIGDKERVLEVRDREDFVHTKRRTRGRAALLKRLNKNKQDRVNNDSPENTKSKTEPGSNTKSTPKNKRKIVKKD